MHKSANIRSFTVQGLALILRRATQVQIRSILKIFTRTEGDTEKDKLEISNFNTARKGNAKAPVHFLLRQFVAQPYISYLYLYQNFYCDI